MRRFRVAERQAATGQQQPAALQCGPAMPHLAARSFCVITSAANVVRTSAVIDSV